MKKYYINKYPQANGCHEVHQEACIIIPFPADKKYLGIFQHCADAVAEAKKEYPSAIACIICSSEYHDR